MKRLEQAKNITKDVFKKAFSGNFMEYKPGMGKTQERQEYQLGSSYDKAIKENDWKNQNREYKKGNKFVGRDHKFFFCLQSVEYHKGLGTQGEKQLNK